MEKQVLFDRLISEACRLGADHAAVVDAAQIRTDRLFRELCAANACGMYGKCYMCPPDIGEIEALMAEVHCFDHALVYQRIGLLEDSFDVEGMMEAKTAHRALAQSLRPLFAREEMTKVLHLGCGGCGLCRPCAKVKGESCVHPDLAMSSLEAYGIDVAHLAALGGMKYINGADTVTYFGAVLFTL